MSLPVSFNLNLDQYFLKMSSKFLVTTKADFLGGKLI